MDWFDFMSAVESIGYRRVCVYEPRMATGGEIVRSRPSNRPFTAETMRFSRERLAHINAEAEEGVI